MAVILDPINELWHWQMALIFQAHRSLLWLPGIWQGKNKNGTKDKLIEMRCFWQGSYYAEKPE